jgi:23S rRNA (cytidine1920-2'-O)/16S rRNA (cytidine1409-2'-O)-methyltransferase
VATSAKPGRSARRPGRRRLDERVVAEGLAESRNLAQSIILSGRVLVADTPIDKPGTQVPDDAEVRLKGVARRFVSRGGEKLEGALADLGLDPSDKSCLDVGASTGGFTDCLLQGGARHVTAVDVGRGQLHARLQADARVTSYERTNARDLAALDLEPSILPIELVVVDVSFISVRLLLDAIDRTAPEADLLVMVKPQFEVGRERVGKGGVVRDDDLRQAAADSVSAAALPFGLAERGRVDARLAGPKGNVEIFVWLSRRVADATPAGR